MFPFLFGAGGGGGWGGKELLCHLENAALLKICPDVGLILDDAADVVTSMTSLGPQTLKTKPA